MFILALFTIARIRKQPKCPPVDEWMQKWCIYTVKYDSAMKKKEILPSATAQMDLKHIVLSGISQREEDKCQVILHICGT